MAPRKLTVVISQSPGKNPVKRELEEEIATQLMLAGCCEVSLIPNLYDLPADHHGLLWLRSISGDLVVLSWLYERAARWTLDRNGISGLEGVTQLPKEEEDSTEEPADTPRGIGSVRKTNRHIYVMDLRQHHEAAVYLEEIQRIAREAVPPPTLVPLEISFGKPEALPAETVAQVPAAMEFKLPLGFPGMTPVASETAVAAPVTDPRRRWYPVIDYSRCTNCMECIDFCLFGVYGVDQLDRILVEEQDNCKRGCPACSRVCPANAIIFPEHKTAAIAGAPTAAAGDFKIDLSKLFGAPSALELAAQERDTELVADGRDAVGLSVGIPKRQSAQAEQPKDDLDNLMDALDDLEL